MFVRDSAGHGPWEPVDERIRIEYDAPCILARLEPLAVGNPPLILDVVRGIPRINSIAVLFQDHDAPLTWIRVPYDAADAAFVLYYHV